MAEKKATKAAATTTKKAAAPKKETVKKVAAKKAELVINAENVGFKAGDVYQALASEAKALTVASCLITEKEISFQIWEELGA